MKKSNIYKLIAVAVVAAGTFSGVATTASAKTKAHKNVKAVKLIKKIKTKHFYEVRGKNGIVYSNYKLKKVVGNLAEHRNTTFKSNTKFVLKLANGKKATYRLINSKNFKGVVLKRDVKVVKVKKTTHHAKSNSNSSASAKSSSASSSAASSSAIATSTSSNSTTGSGSSSASSTGTSSASSTASSVSYTSYDTGSVSASSTTNSYTSTNTAGTTTTSSSNTNSNTSSSNSNSSSSSNSTGSSNSNSANHSSSSDSKNSSGSSNSDSASNSNSSNDKSSTSSNNSSSSNNSNSSSDKSSDSATNSNSAGAPSSSDSKSSDSSNNSNSASSNNSNSAGNSNSSNDKSSENSGNSNSASTPSSSADNNSASSNNSSSASSNASSSDNSIFTSSEADQIKQYQAEAKAIGNGESDSDIYAEKPVVDGKSSFKIGKLNPSYIQNTMDWINYFRKMGGLNPITNNANWNEDAQYGAADIDAYNTANNKILELSHGFSNWVKPSFISDSDWKRGSDATLNSNLSGGYGTGKATPYSVVSGYLNDGSNVMAGSGPGHREWLLGNISQAGVGKSGYYGAIKIFENGKSDGDVNQSPVLFPYAKLFPVELAAKTAWSISVPTATSSSDPQLTVKVHDNTDNNDVSVTGINRSGVSYGNFGTNIWFTPDKNAIKANHSYTITVDGVPGYSTPYTYTTKLFNLGITATN